MASASVKKNLNKTRPKEYENDPGITRERLEDLPPIPLTPVEIKKGKKPRQPIANFRYYYVKDGTDVSQEVLERINNLGIPPAYNHVWISTDAKTHLQATAKDDKNRTQYRYHTRHTLNQDRKKYARVIQFMKALSPFLERIDKDKKRNDLTKNSVIAWMFIVMQELNIRIGNDCYVKNNKSYGLSTLEKKHISFKDLKSGTVAIFKFLGKSKKQHRLVLTLPEAILFVKQMMELPGDYLFQFNDIAGESRIKSTDMNEYMRKYMGKAFSCKDFRTYSANKFFLQFIRHETKTHPPTTILQKKKNLRNALDKTAAKLGHTPSIAKKSYVKYLSDMYMENPERFNSNKNSTELMIELFEKALQENKQIAAGSWLREWSSRQLF